MNVLPAGRRGKANRTCWREVRPHPTGSVCEVSMTGEGVILAPLTLKATIPVPMDPISFSMLAALSYFGLFLSVAALALRVIARYDPDELMPSRTTPNLDVEDELYPREWE